MSYSYVIPDYKYVEDRVGTVIEAMRWRRSTGYENVKAGHSEIDDDLLRACRIITISFDSSAWTGR